MASRFWVGGTGDLDGSTTTHIAATSGGAGGASYPGSGDTLTFDANSGGGTVTVTADHTLQSLTMGAFTGTFDNSVNNNNITVSATASAFSWTGTATRTIRFGTATYTLTNNNARWNFLTSTNATVTGTPNVVFTGASSTRSFDGGGQTYGSVTFGASSGTGYCAISTGNNTFGTLTITGPNYVEFSNSIAQTITTAFNAVGTSSAPIGIFNNATAGTTSTINVPGSTVMDYCAFRDVTFTGSPTAQNSFNFGGVSGVTITGPSAGGGGTTGVIGS